MMKPDTPKFAEMKDGFTTDFAALVKMANEAPKCHPALIKDMQEEAAFMAFYKAAVVFFPQYAAMISAAPKPDCVGVEEIRNSVYKMAFGGNIDEDSDGDYIRVIDEVIDALKTLGLLAMKEKPSE